MTIRINEEDNSDAEYLTETCNGVAYFLKIMPVLFNRIEQWQAEAFEQESGTLVATATGWGQIGAKNNLIRALHKMANPIIYPEHPVLDYRKLTNNQE